MKYCRQQAPSHGAKQSRKPFTTRTPGTRPPRSAGLPAIYNPIQ